jgi:MFS family permease
MKKQSDSIFSLQFWLLCLSSLVFFCSFNMLIPELPDYLTSLGGEEYKGLIISLFTLTAGLSRPFSGRLTDRIGRVPVMAFGSLVCFVCGFFYPVVTTVYPLLFLRLVHGFLPVSNLLAQLPTLQTLCLCIEEEKQWVCTVSWVASEWLLALHLAVGLPLRFHSMPCFMFRRCLLLFR